MSQKMTISRQITTCYEYVDRAEQAAIRGSKTESNQYWRSASNIALSLIKAHDPGTFLDEEYFFLKQIAKHFEDEIDETEYY